VWHCETLIFNSIKLIQIQYYLTQIHTSFFFFLKQKLNSTLILVRNEKIVLSLSLQNPISGLTTLKCKSRKPPGGVLLLRSWKIIRKSPAKVRISQYNSHFWYVHLDKRHKLANKIE